MRLSGYWICCISIMSLLLLSGFACADEIYPTITNVFFEKDGLPFHEPTTFTMNCYGVACEDWACRGPRDNRDPTQYSTDLAYSYHASCPDYGCIIYEPYYHAERLKIDHCDVEGTAGSNPFIIRNYSLSPIPNCTEIHPFDIGKGYDKYYRVTPEFTRCENDTRRKAVRCDQYVVPCEPGKDYECGYWVVDGKNVKKTPSYRACMDTIDRERVDCDQFLKKIDPATMIMWNYSGYGKSPAMRSCDLRFSIPSSGQATALNQSIPGLIPGAPISTTIHYQSPVESLYCRILQFLGGRCE